MTFDSKGYLAVAQELMEREGLTAPQDARCRSAISRAYYAVYGVARSFAAARPGFERSSGSEHSALSRWFKNQSSPRFRKVGHMLQRLHDQRKSADYGDEIENPLDQARASIRGATDILRIIEEQADALMPSLHDLMPDVANVLALEPEELAEIVLIHLNSSYGDGVVSRQNFSLPHTVREQPRERQDEILSALMEAWAWLEREGLIVPKPGDMTLSQISRRGRRFVTAGDLNAYRMANILPKATLHPVIAGKVWSAFLRGDYDVAVFQAIKEVEVAVRTAGKFAPNDLGVKLMRAAFGRGGPLRDAGAHDSEEDGLMELFTGAVGHGKNPSSHRNGH